MLNNEIKERIKELCKNNFKICQISKILNIEYRFVYNYIKTQKLSHNTEMVIDILNQKFGRLLVINRTNKKRQKSIIWRCKCDCGNIVDVCGTSLRNETTKSCGCLQKQKVQLMSKNRFAENHPNWKGYYEITGRQFQKIINRANKTNIEFNLKIEYLWDLFLKQNRKCALSGVELNFLKNDYDREHNASLDRIDSSKGYIEGNVQWVDKYVNTMKGSKTDKEFIEWCQKIVNNQEKKL